MHGGVARKYITQCRQATCGRHDTMVNDESVDDRSPKVMTNVAFKSYPENLDGRRPPPDFGQATRLVVDASRGASIETTPSLKAIT